MGKEVELKPSSKCLGTKNVKNVQEKKYKISIAKETGSRRINNLILLWMNKGLRRIPKRDSSKVFVFQGSQLCTARV